MSLVNRGPMDTKQLLKPLAIFLLYVTNLSLIVNVVFSDTLLFVPMIVFNNFHDFAKSFCGD